MRLFVYEHICGGGPMDQPPPSLLREGWSMLRSILADLVAVDKIEEIATLLNPRIDAARRQLPPGVSAAGADGNDPSRWAELFAAEVARSDLALLIAPESNGDLPRLTRRVLELGGEVLGCTPAALVLSGDKHRFAAELARRGLPTPPTRRLSLSAIDRAGAAGENFSYPLVLKPRFGAGCLWTWLIDGPGELRSACRLARAQGAPDEMLVCQYAPGLPASVSFIVGGGRALALAAGEQRIVLGPDGRFSYQGGRMPIANPRLAARAVSLAWKAVRCLDGLRGFVGVDLVLDAEAASPEAALDAVIELNPRLTTSYLGLRILHGGGRLAAALLDCHGQPPILSSSPPPLERLPVILESSRLPITFTPLEADFAAAPAH